jgi:N6-L-threonylcarbamoyladenine synthase
LRQEIADRFPGEVYYPRMAYCTCTDNGAMIAVAGALRLADARPIGEIRAQARWPLDSLAAPATTD